MERVVRVQQLARDINQEIHGVVDTELKEFPSNTEGRLEVLLSNFSKSTASVVLLLMPPDMTAITPKDLYRRFVTVYHGTGFEVVNKNTPTEYGNYLGKGRLVAVQKVRYQSGYQSVIGFSLTEAGRRYGRLAASLDLDFESKFHISPFEVLGTPNHVSKQGHTAPYTRAMLLNYLLEEGHPQRLMDIIRAFSIDHVSAASALDSLALTGVLNRQRYRDRSVFFTINDKGVKLVLEFLRPLYKIAADDKDQKALQDGVLSKVIANLPYHARTTAPFYFEHSHSKMMRDHDRNIALLLAILDQSPNGKTKRELSEAVGLHPATVGRILSRRLEERRVLKLTLRKPYRFFSARRYEAKDQEFLSQ